LLAAGFRSLWLGLAWLCAADVVVAIVFLLLRSLRRLVAVIGSQSSKRATGKSDCDSEQHTTIAHNDNGKAKPSNITMSQAIACKPYSSKETV
jgi:hypothetical protein